MLPTITHLFRISRPMEELKYSKNGTAFGNVGLVCSEKYKEKETTLWLNGTAFGKTAELISTMPKGSQIFIVGKISTDEWTAQDGTKKTKTALTIDRFQFVDKRSDTYNDNVDRPDRHNVAGAINRPTEGMKAEAGTALPEIDIDEGDIPF